MGGALLAQDFDVEFDVVVAGAGSAGCVLATRLTENPAITLCVIEAGGRDRNPWIHIPMGFGKLVPNPKVNWGYETEPEPGLGGRKIIWPRGWPSDRSRGAHQRRTSLRQTSSAFRLRARGKLCQRDKAYHLSLWRPNKP